MFELNKQNKQIFFSTLIRTGSNQWHIQAVWETGIPVWAPKFWCSKNIFQVFFCQLCFQEKYIELVIIDFPVPLVTSKRFGIQKCRQKSKTMRQKDVEAEEETVYEKVFIHLNTK